MVQQTSSLAYLFEEIGIEKGKAEERKEIFDELREAAEADASMTIEEFLKKQKDD